MLRLPGDRLRHRLATIAILTVFVAAAAAAFAISIVVRMPYLGVSGDFGSILQWTLQWYTEGPLALKFGLFDHFPALETPTLELRLAYASYPPGTIVVPWLVAAILHTEPTTTLISIVNMASQFVLALTLGAIAAVFALRFRWPPILAAVVALAPILVTLLSRGPVHYFMIYHVHDVAVLPWVALFLLMEALLDRASGRRRRIVVIAQQAVAFLGAFTDWLFFFVLAAVFIKRVVFGQIPWRPARRAIGSMAAFGAGPAAAMAIYVYSLASLDQWPRLISRFIARTGLAEDRPDQFRRLFKSFWDSALSWNFNNARLIWWTYATLATLLLWVALVAWRRRSLGWLRRESRELLAFVLILMIAPVVQIYVFSDHTYHHLWSGLKFVLVLGLVTFALGPMLLIETIRDSGVSLTALRGVSAITTAAWLYAAASYGYVGAQTITANFEPPRFEEQLVGKAIRKYAEPTDIIVSPQLEALPKSVMFSVSRRVVYLSPDPSRALFISSCLGVPHDFLVVAAAPLPPLWQSALVGTAVLAREHGLTFTRITSSELAANLKGSQPPYEETQCSRAGIARLAGKPVLARAGH